jgi:preprotein translocase subunit YajC
MTTAAVWAAGVVLAATTKKTSGGSATFLIILVLLGLAGYFLFLRPQQQKARKQRELQSDIEVGDEVLTVGGIVGTVISINSERVTIVTGAEPGSTAAEPPTRMVLVRNAIARKIEPTVAVEDEPSEPETDGHPGYGGVPDANHADPDDATPEVGDGEGTTSEGPSA